MAKAISTISENLKLRWKHDPFYHSIWVNKFINSFVKVGNKRSIEFAVYQAFKRLKLKWNIQPIELLLWLIISNRILVETKPRRKSRVFLQIPTPVFGVRRYALPLKHLSHAIIVRPEQTVSDRIYNELTSSCIYRRGTFLKFSVDAHTIVLKNRMYLRYRW